MSKGALNGRYRVKRNRASTCGSKDGGSSYDPQVGAAAQANAANAAQATQFDQNYYTNTIAPLVAAETAQANTTTDQQTQLFGLNLGEAQQAKNQYDTYGVPAQDAYYGMVKNFNSQQEADSEAQGAIGDMRTAEASNAGTLSRQQQGLGINPASGAAISAASDASTTNTAAEAAAATRARYNAKTMGMQLTADAASFANTGISNLNSTSAGASSDSSSALGAQSTALAGANSGAAVPNTGYSLASGAYGNNLDAYSKLASADIQSSASADSGLGSFLGSGLALATKYLPSDRRLKRNVRRIGASRHSIPIYEFDYIWGGKKQIGCMADEVERIIPEAVVIHESGYKMVDYGLLR